MRHLSRKSTCFSSQMSSVPSLKSMVGVEPIPQNYSLISHMYPGTWTPVLEDKYHTNTKMMMMVVVVVRMVIMVVVLILVVVMGECICNFS